MYNEILDKTKQNLEAALNYLKEELGKLRGSRAQGSLVEDIKVDCYNGKYTLKELAAINTPSPNLIVIEPWDKSIVENINSAISHSSLEINPVVDGEAIRINIPPLSEERRKELSKIVSEKLENVRISIRRHRDEAWKEVQELERKSEISEDDKFRAKDELQEMVDEYNKQAEEMAGSKEKELMSV